ncbi:Asp23/Gls24 family envelope stress response protein [Amycolatopsis samaneae]|uniref:Asp23/Gls24 family envelope stress response protein n=1 Tax=Amycolatopsis samaneae TaxID=664691 RepID=A0ABW5GG77_9PSEU
MTAAAVPAGPADLAPEDRGRTTLADRAVRRIAAHAVGEVDGVGADVQVSARIDEESATLDVRLPVRYPAPVARTTEQARAHVTARTAELTGLTVRRVDITVSALPNEPVTTRRVR